ncbi:UNVERIFIED_CONTAM: hypothetical protein Sradi_1693900 [Sesamum radiatum]|uniref:DUF4283 domain-containing protein n=1 Tax=Sesamum radiatum TaxID=300843 RepID=A0AAW2TT14_SESRA
MPLSHCQTKQTTLAYGLRRIWYLNGFPMRVFKWSPTFTPDIESPIVPIWVSLPTLPAHLFRKETLFAIASNIGTPLQIADSTFNQSNLSKARVCVEVDLLKPLLEEIDIKICGQTIVQRIEYEEVPRYCTLCKHLGHNDAECYSKGDALKTPRRRVKGKTAATVKEKWEAVRNEPTVDKEGECSKTADNCHDNALVEILPKSTVTVQLTAFSVENEAHDNDFDDNAINHVVEDNCDIHGKENHVQNDIIDEVHAENSASNAENESLNVIVEHVFVENGVNIEHEFLVEHGNVCTIANDNEKVEDDESDDNEQSCNDTFGALILRPDNFLCDLKKRTSWLKVDNALRLFDTFIKFGRS